MNTVTHDVLRHLKSLRQTLSQDKKPIAFFISAGCPLSIDMGTGNPPLIPDMQGLAQHVASELTSKDPTNPSLYDKLMKELKTTSKNEHNLEDILSFVRSLKEVAQGGGIVRGLKEHELADLERDICKHITSKIKVELPNNQTPYHKLANWISSIDRDKEAIEIFTTNYDLLMEQALEDMTIPYFDGFVGSRQSFFDLRSVEENLIPNHWARLWKIHGSINWFQKANKEVFRSDTYKIDDNNASYLIYPSHLKYDQSRKMPFLALSDQLSHFLKQPSAALILCGYSFNDEHINNTIVNALKSNPASIVVALMFGNMKNDKDKENYSKGVEIAIQRHNISFWTNDEAIIGTNRGKWTNPQGDIDDDLKQFIDEKADAKIKLRDFKIFADFLSSLIGQPTDEKKDAK
jgi:hypothetical protein